MAFIPNRYRLLQVGVIGISGTSKLMQNKVNGHCPTLSVWLWTGTTTKESVVHAETAEGFKALLVRLSLSLCINAEKPCTVYKQKAESLIHVIACPLPSRKPMTLPLYENF